MDKNNILCTYTNNLLKVCFSNKIYYYNRNKPDTNCKGILKKPVLNGFLKIISAHNHF